MICASVLYPMATGAKFDHAYYQTQHRALIQEKLAGALTRIEMDKGLSGMMPGSEPAFAGGARLYFNSLGDFQQAMMAHGPALMADIPNFTNIQPQIQVNETA